MNSAKDVVRRLLDQSGIILLKASEVLTDDEFFFEPPDGASMAWTLGHLAAFQDWSLTNFSPGERRVLDSETREFFRGGKLITEEDKRLYKGRHEMEALFRDTQARTIKALNAFDLDRWGEPTPTGCRYPNAGAVWESMAYENYWHLGQLSVCIPRLSGTSLTVPVPRPFSLSFDGK
jgi:hypothetical protein